MFILFIHVHRYYKLLNKSTKLLLVSNELDAMKNDYY